MTEESEAKQQLQASIEKLYETFARYPLRPQIHGCEHCVSPEDDARIRSKPLRHLTGEDLQRYAHKAMTTWGDEYDFKHFLPRLFELWAGDAINLVLPDGLMKKLELADWYDWPEQEQIAIFAFLESLWKAKLMEDISTETLNDYLYAIATSVGDVSPYLQQWNETAAQSEVSQTHLAHFVVWHYPYLPGGELFQWDDEQEAMEQVVEWLNQQDIFALLEQGFFRTQDEAASALFSRACDVLTLLRNARALTQAELIPSP